MGYITPEQAAEAAKGLNFEKVWTALMESRQSMDELFRRSEEAHAKGMAELRAELNKSIGGLGNSLGRFIETMFTPDLLEKFDKLGFTFNTQANYKQFHENKKCVAEVDSVLENGEYVLLVEIKTNLSVDNVNEHLERIEIIRQYMDKHGDIRKIVGAVAGGIVPKNVQLYAQRKGMFVLVQNGDAVSIAEMPANFKSRIW